MTWWAQPPPLATIDLFPLGAREVAFERLSALLTSLQDMLTTLRASSEVPTTAGATTASGSKPQILFADLAKKAAESDAKAHKWEIEELRNTIAGLRDELSGFSSSFWELYGIHCIVPREEKVKAEKKLAPTSRLQDISPAQDNLASYLPPNDEVKAGPALEPQREMEVTNPEPSVCCFLLSSSACIGHAHHLLFFHSRSKSKNNLSSTVRR